MPKSLPAQRPTFPWCRAPWHLAWYVVFCFPWLVYPRASLHIGSMFFLFGNGSVSQKQQYTRLLGPCVIFKEHCIYFSTRVYIIVGNLILRRNPIKSHASAWLSELHQHLSWIHWHTALRVQDWHHEQCCDEVDFVQRATTYISIALLDTCVCYSSWGWPGYKYFCEHNPIKDMRRWLYCGQAPVQWLCPCWKRAWLLCMKTIEATEMLPEVGRGGWQHEGYRPPTTCI